MVKINEVLNYNGVDFKRVSYTRVKNLIAKGIVLELNLITNNANLFSPWVNFATQTIHDLKELDCFINSFHFFNCDIGLGNRIHYYIKA